MKLLINNKILILHENNFYHVDEIFIIKKYESNLYKFIYLEVENQKIKTVHVNTGKEKNCQFIFYWFKKKMYKKLKLNYFILSPFLYCVDLFIFFFVIKFYHLQ